MILAVGLLGFAVAASAGDSCAEPPTPLDQVLGIHTVTGTLVTTVDPRSAGERAGLARCDIVAAVNGQELRHYATPEAFIDEMREAAMFSLADLGVWKYDAAARSYRQSTTQLKIPAQPKSRIGVTLQLAILVLEVADAGPAARAGLTPGDFIDEINDEDVTSLKSIIDVDQRINGALSRDGSVKLTLVRWQPLDAADGPRLTYTNRRQVTVQAQPSARAATSAERASGATPH
jgi:S1-C subfamily serine protease